MNNKRMNYLRQCESLLFRLAKCVRNKEGVHPSTQGPQLGQLLMEIRTLDGSRYDREVLLVPQKVDFVWDDESSRNNIEEMLRISAPGFIEQYLNGDWNTAGTIDAKGFPRSKEGFVLKPHRLKRKDGDVIVKYKTDKDIDK